MEMLTVYSAPQPDIVEKAIDKSEQRNRRGTFKLGTPRNESEEESGLTLIADLSLAGEDSLLPVDFVFPSASPSASPSPEPANVPKAALEPKERERTKASTKTRGVSVAKEGGAKSRTRNAFAMWNKKAEESKKPKITPRTQRRFFGLAHGSVKKSKLDMALASSRGSPRKPKKSKIDRMIEEKNRNAAQKPKFEKVTSPRNKARFEKSLSPRTKLDQAIENRRQSGGKPEEVISPRSRSKLDKALAERKNSRSKSDADRGTKVIVSAPPVRRGGLKKGPRSQTKRKKLMFSDGTENFTREKNESKASFRSLSSGSFCLHEGESMTISREAILKRTVRTVSIAGRKSVSARTANARNFFQNVATRKSGLSIVEKPSLARARHVSIVGRKSVTQRAQQARAAFVQKAEEDGKDHYKSTTCPACGFTVYPSERYKDGWHKFCYLTEHKLTGKYKKGANLETPYGLAKVLEFDRSRDFFHVKFPFGEGFLHDDSVEWAESGPVELANEKTLGELENEMTKTHTAGRDKFFKIEKETYVKVNDICPACERKVYPGDPHSIMKQTRWHANCFRCYICQNAVQTTTYKSHEEKPMCFACYEEEVLAEYWANILDPADYECDMPANYLAKLRITEEMEKLFHLIRKAEVQFFSVLIEGEIAMTPEYVQFTDRKGVSFFDHDETEEFLEIASKKKHRRADLMEAMVYRGFWESLTQTGECRIGLIHLVFKLSDETVSRICEKLVCCVFIPPDAPVKDKLLYGSAAGILHNEISAVAKVIAGGDSADFHFKDVLALIRKDFRY